MEGTIDGKASERIRLRIRDPDVRVPTYPSHVFSPFYKGVSEDDVRDAAKIRKILPITIIDVHLFFFFSMYCSKNLLTLQS